VEILGGGASGTTFNINNGPISLAPQGTSWSWNFDIGGSFQIDAHTAIESFNTLVEGSTTVSTAVHGFGSAGAEITRLLGTQALGVGDVAALRFALGVTGLGGTILSGSGGYMIGTAINTAVINPLTGGEGRAGVWAYDISHR
jgi:hypothetical protein